MLAPFVVAVMLLSARPQGQHARFVTRQKPPLRLLAAKFYSVAKRKLRKASVKSAFCGQPGSGVDVRIARRKWDQVRRLPRDRDPRVDAEIGPDVHEFARGEHAPAALSVELLGGDDDRGCGFQRGHMHR